MPNIIAVSKLADEIGCSVRTIKRHAIKAGILITALGAVALIDREAWDAFVATLADEKPLPTQAAAVAAAKAKAAADRVSP
jgi:hypothetical protein